MEVRGGRSQSGAPEGPLRFECPEEFAASPFAPGPPLSPESLRDPSKQLVLIRAPANFSPESLEGHTVPLLGFQILKAPQSDGTQKVYQVQATPGEQASSARLLVPSGHLDLLTCAPPFGSSLTFCERYGDPSANQPLFPVAARPAPQIPEGLKQRFLPFGGCPKRPLLLREAAEEPPRKKKKKKRTFERVGDPQEHPLVKQEESWVSGGPQANSEGLVVQVEAAPEKGAGEERHRSKKRRKQKRKEEEGEMVAAAPSAAELRPHTGGDGSPEAGEEEAPHKHKKKRKHEEEAGLSSPQACLAQVKEEPELGLPKKKKKKREKAKEEQGTVSLEPSSGKQELGGWGELEAPSVSPGGGGGQWQSSELRAEDLSQKHHRKKKKKREKAEEEQGTVSLEASSVTQELGGWGELEAPSVPPGGVQGQGESSDLRVDDLSQKHHKKKKKKAEECGMALLEPSSVTQELGGWGELEAPSVSPEGGGQGESSELRAEDLSQKHHKKRKKKHKREEEPVKQEPMSELE